MTINQFWRGYKKKMFDNSRFRLLASYLMIRKWISNVFTLNIRIFCRLSLFATKIFFSLSFFISSDHNQFEFESLKWIDHHFIVETTKKMNFKHSSVCAHYNKSWMNTCVWFIIIRSASQSVSQCYWATWPEK